MMLTQLLPLLLKPGISRIVVSLHQHILITLCKSNYVPEQRRHAAEQAATGHIHFDVALDADQLIGFCQLGITAHDAQLFASM